ncbi:MAG TPA: PQQ-dependent sugar dehydrogenase [Azospirillum sp.]|nr:PQQ-dependent sugar dehydrogenase [Azospirillum sp.]
MSVPGERFFIDPNALPPPTGQSLSNGSTGVGRPAGVLPQVPAGFEVSVFAEGLGTARWIEVAPNGDVLLARPDRGDVRVLRDADGDGRAETVSTLASGFSSPHGMAVGTDGLYVVDVNAVWRVPYTPGDLAARGGAARLTEPGALGGTGGHTLRSLALSSDGRSLYVGIGSEGNLGEEPSPRASILQVSTAGGPVRTVATGLRNPAGLEVEPSTGRLVAAVVERDGMGDELVPDYLTRVEEGGFYGWPYAYIGPNPQPNLAARRPDLVGRTLTPDVLFQAHSTPIGFTFYTGAQFPASYAGDAFVALRGSWNASSPHGFMLAHVDVQNGAPINGYDAFMTGFLLSEGANPTVYGRPTTAAVAADGSLLVGDDFGGTIYRVRYAPRGGAAADALVGGLGTDTIVSAGGTDTVTGDGGNDVLLGNAGNDLLFGNVGSDALYGGRDHDLLFGGRGDDLLFGDPGDDTLSGDPGNDTLTGGEGRDTFRFGLGGGRDQVVDFDYAQGDRLSVGGLAWSVADRAGTAVIVFSADDEVLLRGVRANEVGADWFVA